MCLPPLRISHQSRLGYKLAQACRFVSCRFNFRTRVPPRSGFLGPTITEGACLPPILSLTEYIHLPSLSESQIIG